MGHKFKVGDKVRCIENYSDHTTKGNIYTVVEVSGRDGRWVHVQRDDINAVGGYASEDFEIVQPTSTNNWTEWNGGECPVAAGTRVEMRFRNGSVELADNPEDWYWAHFEGDGDILAYRVVEEDDEENPFLDIPLNMDNPCSDTVTPEDIRGYRKEPQEDSGSAATSKHYNSKLIQPIEIAQMVLTKEEFKGAMKFNIMKYTQRAGSKEGESSQKDWNKALQYKLWLELAENGVTIDPRRDVV